VGTFFETQCSNELTICAPVVTANYCEIGMYAWCITNLRTSVLQISLTNC